MRSGDSAYSRGVSYAHQPYRPFAPQPIRQPFVPLGGRTHFVAASIAARCVSDFAMDGIQLAFANDLRGETPALGPALLLGAAGLATLLTLVLGAVSYGVFIVQAANNIRALGRVGMEYSPGWCIGWFFVPFANLVKPVRAFTEVWKASDPTVLGTTEWRHQGKGDARIGVWWGAWIISNLIGGAAGKIDDPSLSSMVGLLGSTVSAVAGVICCVLIYKLAARQNEAAAFLASAPRPIEAFESPSHV